MHDFSVKESRDRFRLNDGKLDEHEMPVYDIYTQEYYLHAFSLLSKERKNFQESKEGHTYIMFKSVDAITKRLMGE